MGAWRHRQPPPPAEPEEDPGAWVRGGPVPELPASTHIAAVDPGRKLTFTAAVYETTAQPLWQQLQQVQAGVSGQGTHQVGPLAPWLPEPYGRPAGVEEPAPAGQAVHLPTVSWTAGKWYEEAGHNHRRRQQQRWLHLHPDLEVCTGSILFQNQSTHGACLESTGAYSLIGALQVGMLSTARVVLQCALSRQSGKESLSRHQV